MAGLILLFPFPFLSLLGNPCLHFEPLDAFQLIFLSYTNPTSYSHFQLQSRGGERVNFEWVSPGNNTLPPQRVSWPSLVLKSCFLWVMWALVTSWGPEVIHGRLKKDLFWMWRQMFQQSFGKAPNWSCQFPWRALEVRRRQACWWVK